MLLQAFDETRRRVRTYDYEARLLCDPIKPVVDSSLANDPLIRFRWKRLLVLAVLVDIRGFCIMISRVYP